MTCHFFPKKKQVEDLVHSHVLDDDLISPEDEAWYDTHICVAATHFNTMQITATRCNPLQRAATRCNKLLDENLVYFRG